MSFSTLRYHYGGLSISDATGLGASIIELSPMVFLASRTIRKTTAQIGSHISITSPIRTIKVGTTIHTSQSLPLLYEGLSEPLKI